MKWCTDSRVHAIWYFRERLYKEPLVLAKNKESLITIEISGPKEQYFFSVICFCLSKDRVYSGKLNVICMFSNFWTKLTILLKNLTYKM